MYSFKKLAKETTKYKKEFFTAQSIAILATIVSIPIPLFIPFLVDELLLHKNHTWIDIISKFLGKLDLVGYVFATLFVVIVLRSCFAFLQVAQIYYFEKITKNIAYKIRIRVLEHLKRLSINEYENLKVGDIASRLVSDLNTLEEFLVKSVSKFFISLLMVVGVSVVLLSINLKLGIFILLLNPFVLVLSGKIAKNIRKYKKMQNHTISLFQESLIETLELFEQIKAYNKEGFFFSKLFNASDTLKNKAFDFSYKSEAYSKISFLIVLIGYEVFRCAGILAVAYDNLSIGMMLAVFGYLWFMMTPLQEVISIQYSYFSAKAALERINEVLSMRKEPMFKHIANPFFEDVTIEVVDLNFGYKDLLFENCNCKIAPHKVTAIIGASGSGKSTFAKLICGFLLPNSGDIKYNKSSYCEIGLDVIRDNVALILQETRLFNDTVLFNLTLGKEFDDLEIVEALKKAEIYNTITAMENGINTMVGKNGVKLSGGQKQRIAIARMLLHKPKIVILDESTSALDIDTEDRVMKNIESFLKSRTSIIIAHRAETIAKADEILMIKDKKIKKL